MPRVLKCPICGADMIIQDALGTPVDVCLEHGFWLDKGELAKIITAAKAEVEKHDHVMQTVSWANNMVFGRFHL